MPKELYLRQGSIVAVVSTKNDEDYWLAEVRRAGAEKNPSIRWLDRNPRNKLEYCWCVGVDVLDRKTLLDTNVKFSRRDVRIESDEDKRLREKRKLTPVEEPEPVKAKVRVKPVGMRPPPQKKAKQEPSSSSSSASSSSSPPPASSSTSSSPTTKKPSEKSSSSSSTVVTPPRKARPPSVEVIPESDNSFFSPVDAQPAGCKVSAFPTAPPETVPKSSLPPTAPAAVVKNTITTSVPPLEVIVAGDDTYSSLPTMKNNSPTLALGGDIRTQPTAITQKTPSVQDVERKGSESPPPSEVNSLTLENVKAFSRAPTMKDNMQRVQRYIENQREASQRTRRRPLNNSVTTCLESKENSAWIIVSSKNRLKDEPLPNEMITHVTKAMGAHRGWIKSCEIMTSGEGYIVLFNGSPPPPVLRGLVSNLQSLVGVCVDDCTVTSVVPVILNNTDFEASHRSSASRNVQNRNTLFFANSGFSPWQTLSHCTSTSPVSFAVVNNRSEGGSIIMVTFSDENLDIAALAIQMCSLGHRHDQVWLVGRSKTNIKTDIPLTPTPTT